MLTSVAVCFPRYQRGRSRRPNRRASANALRTDDMDGRRTPQTHPNELLISLQSGDMNSGLPFNICPVQDVRVAVNVHAGHAEGSTEKVLFGRTGGGGKRWWRTGAGEEDEYGVVLGVLRT